MSEQVTVEYQRDAIGHPEAGTVLTVERTPAVEALLELGIVVDVDAPDVVENHADGAVHPDPGPDELVVAGVPVPDGGTASDGDDTDQGDAGQPTGDTDGTDSDDPADPTAGDPVETPAELEAVAKPAKKAAPRKPRRRNAEPDND
jgi:hypothetical protein